MNYPVCKRCHFFAEHNGKLMCIYFDPKPVSNPNTSPKWCPRR